jgi:predicted HTH domain antitoxin
MNIEERRKKTVQLFESGLFSINQLAEYFEVSTYAISKRLKTHYDKKKYNQIKAR